jgi:hypothetical protein
MKRSLSEEFIRVILVIGYVGNDRLFLLVSLSPFIGIAEFWCHMVGFGVCTQNHKILIRGALHMYI